MKKYEYRIEIIKYLGPSDLVKYLNELGQEGWHCFDIKHGPTESNLSFARVVIE